MTTQSTPLEQSEAGRAFLQRRIARFGLFGAAIGGFFLMFRLVELFFLLDGESVMHPSMVFHALGAFGSLAIWLGCRGGPKSVRHLRAFEATGLIGASVAYSAMGQSIPLAARPDFVVLLAVTYGLLARSIYVPSTAARTFLLTSLAAIAPLTMTFVVMQSMDQTKWGHVLPDIIERDPTQIASSVTAFIGGWWLVAIVICTAASRVIFGLRKEVHHARRLGQYTLETKLGEGGMGIVYRAHHAMLRRPTAIKLLPTEKAGEVSIARFEREVQLTARLTHPNTVTVFDYGRTPEGVFYYAMELLDGATVREIVQLTGPLPAARVIHILDQVAGALAEAHGVDLIHRDIKPANIMLVQQGGVDDVAKVLDFGLVKELKQERNVALTGVDTLTGTPQYMSPESIKSPDGVDARSDLYALGAVGYFLLTGQHVFDADSIVEICSHHLHTRPVPPSERLGTPVPDDLERLLLRCLEKAPDDRPSDALELADELRRCRIENQWTTRDASDWWQTHGADLRSHRPKAGSLSNLETIEVDLRHRAND